MPLIAPETYEMTYAYRTNHIYKRALARALVELKKKERKFFESVECQPFLAFQIPPLPLTHLFLERALAQSLGDETMKLSNFLKANLPAKQIV